MTDHSTLPPRTAIASVAAAASLLLGACGSSASSATATASVSSATATAAAAPPSPPSGNGGGAPGGSSTPTYTPTGEYTLSGGHATKSGATIVASGGDRSGVLVTNGGVLTLLNPTVKTTGDSRSNDESSFYGLDSGVLANARGKVIIRGGSVVTSGSGANGVFAYGSGASATVSNASITATGNGSHGAMTAGGGSVALANVHIHTSGQSAAAIATDRGGGTIVTAGGTWITNGFKSPGIYSTGLIKVTGATIAATGAEAAVIEGANSISVTNSSLKAAIEHGVMLYQSMSGDANAGTGTYTMTGGSLTAAAGPAFYVTNETAVITVKGSARVSATSGVLLRADAAGTGSGNAKPGKVTFNADGENLAGAIFADTRSSIAASLTGSSTLTSTITNASLTLGSGSRWIVAGDSTLQRLTGAAISGTSITNITGDGHTVTYSASLAPNSSLGGKTYTLAGGGTLKPA